MATQTIAPENFPERLVWFAITGTYGFYLLGALYIVAPVLAWVLLCYLLWQLYWQDPALPKSRRISISGAAWVWIIGMLVMLVALIMGHIDFKLGAGKLIKSSIGWAKGWALLAIFPLLGSLSVRAELIYRATNIVCLHTLLLLPLFVAAYLLQLPETLYVSPLKAVGGPGPEFFSLSLYEIDFNGFPRFRLFTPWAPALGFVANIFFIFALQDRSKKWRYCGIAGSISMILISQSRLALVALAIVSIACWGLSRLRQPGIMFLAAGGSTAAGISGVWLLEAFEQLWTAFRAARADSSRVREALARIAVDRWYNEAPVWGHGILERGPHMVEFMLIGSHHSWYGLLFVKGIAGLLALALPMLWSFIVLLVKAQHLPIARVALAMILILFLYTFGENLEILAYLFWPALIIMGLAFNTKSQNKQHENYTSD